ncbi:MAG: ExbD/TolR family protein [Methyloligellaceae bacterium]
MARAISLSRRRKRPGSMGLTPLVDVIFLLLVFYLLVSQFSEFTTLPVTLSEKGAVTTSTNSWAITVSGTGEIRFNGEAVSIEEVTNSLSSRNPDQDTFLTLRVADAVPLQTAVAILEQVKAAGIANASVTTWKAGP